MATFHINSKHTFFDNSFLDFLLSSLVHFFRFFLLDLVLGSHTKEAATVFGSTIAFFLFISCVDNEDKIILMHSRATPLCNGCLHLLLFTKHN